MGGSQHALLYETTVQAVGGLKLADDCLTYVPSLQRSFHRSRDATYTRGGKELWNPVLKTFQLDGFLQQVQKMQALVGSSEDMLAELYFCHFDDADPGPQTPGRAGRSHTSRKSSVRTSQEKLQLGLRLSRFASDLVHCLASSIVTLQLQTDSPINWFPRVMCSMIVDLVDVVHLLDVLKDKKESLFVSLDDEAQPSASRGVDTSLELQNLMQAQRFISSSWAVMSQLSKELENLQKERGHTAVVLAKLLDFTHTSLTAKDSQQLLLGKMSHVYMRALPVLLNLYCCVSGSAAGFIPEGFDMKLVDKCLGLIMAKPIMPGFGDAVVNLVEPLLIVPLLSTPIRDRDRPKVMALTQHRDFARLEQKYSLATQVEYIRQRHNELLDSIAKLAFFVDSCRRRLEVPPPEVVSEVLTVCMGCMWELARWSGAIVELDAWRITHPTLPLGYEDDAEQKDQNPLAITQRPSFQDDELVWVLEVLAYVKGVSQELSSHFTWMEPLLHQLAYQEMQQVAAGPLAHLIKPPGQQGFTPQQQKVQDLAVALKQCVQGLQSPDAMMIPAPKKRLTRVFTNIMGKKGQEGRMSPAPGSMMPSSPRFYETQQTGGMAGGSTPEPGSAPAGTAWSGSGMMKSVSKLFKSKSEANMAETETDTSVEILRQAPTHIYLQLLSIITEQLLSEIHMSHPKREGESKGLSRTIKSVAYNFNPEVSTSVVKGITAFNYLLSSLDLMLILPDLMRQVADMSDLCLTESFVEKNMLPHPSISDLPVRLADAALHPMVLLPVDLGLIPLNLYDDTWARVRHWAPHTDLPGLVALSGASYMDKFLENASLQAYEHFKAIACQHIVSCATFLYGTTAISAGFYPEVVQPCTFDNLFKQQSMDRCGVRMNPREQLAYRIQLLILDDIQRLLDRFDLGKDITILTELEFGIRLIQQTHKLLSQHLPLDGWNQTWALLDPGAYQLTPKPDDAGHKITAACLPMITNYLLPLFLYNSHTRKFVPRLPPTTVAPSPQSVQVVTTPGSQVQAAAAAALPGFPPDSVSFPLWSFLMAKSNSSLDQPEDAPAPNPSYFGVEHVLALKKLTGPKGVATLVNQIQKFLKDLLENDIPVQLQQLAACLPAEVLQPSSHITTATGVFSYYNRHLAQVSTQKAIWEEPLKVLHMFGNAIALLHLVNTALYVDAANNMLQVSPMLGVFAEEGEGIRHCPHSQPTFFEKLVLGNYAVRVPPMAKGALVQAERKGWAATRSLDMWPKIWSDLSSSVTGLEATMNATFTASTKKGTPPQFHAVWSALLWVIIDQEITLGASRQLPYGEGPLWAGCFILHMLQEQNKFKIQDFTTLLLKREQLDSSGQAAGGKAAHMHNFVAIATRVMEIWQQVCITAQRLLEPELPVDDDEAQLEVLQSVAIPRYEPAPPGPDEPVNPLNAPGGSEAGGAGIAQTFNNFGGTQRAPFNASQFGPKPSSMIRQESSVSRLSVPASEDFAHWRPDYIAPSERTSQVSDLDATMDQRMMMNRAGGFNSSAVMAAFIKPPYSKPAAPEHSGMSPNPSGPNPSPQPQPLNRPRTAKVNPWSKVLNNMTAESGPRSSPGLTRQVPVTSAQNMGPVARGQGLAPGRSLSPAQIRPFMKNITGRQK